jgi:hypothetical protein
MQVNQNRANANGVIVVNRPANPSDRHGMQVNQNRANANGAIVVDRPANPSDRHTMVVPQNHGNADGQIVIARNDTDDQDNANQPPRARPDDRHRMNVDTETATTTTRRVIRPVPTYVDDSGYRRIYQSDGGYMVVPNRRPRGYQLVVEEQTAPIVIDGDNK